MASKLRRVFLETPYQGETVNDILRNVAYARACMSDSLSRGEAPFASHLLYTQDGVLDDKQADERELGIAAGLSWAECADATIVYEDQGISDGMRLGIQHAKEAGREIVYRTLSDDAKNRLHHMGFHITGPKRRNVVP